MSSNQKKKKTQPYIGFELGPIRPPSEAESLLIRVTRNCPWNHCTFCGIYRDKKFSLRSVEHVIRDIDLIRRYVDEIHDAVAKAQKSGLKTANPFPRSLDDNEQMAFYAAFNWVRNGMKSIFLQDSNSLIIKPDHLLEILTHIKKCFPRVERITSYARSHTIARIRDENLELMARAGLNRIHIGMESGSNKVLEQVKKGVDKATHIRAGRKIKRAGIQLSEYFMPGLGGRKLSRDHALESADALNHINADFVRLRTLAIPRNVELHKALANGTFQQMGDKETAEEILLFLENLEGITTTIKRDHILNLFEEVEGTLPGEKEKMTGVIRKFLNMEPREQIIYQVGRRSGIFSRLGDLNNPGKRAMAEQHCNEFNVTPDNVDQVMGIIMKQFI